MKKIECSVNINIVEHENRPSMGISYPGDLDIRINIFFGRYDYYFTFYSGILSKRRALKRTTWIYELLYHREERLSLSRDSYVVNPIRMISNVIRDGRFEYKKVNYSVYLIKRLFKDSDKSVKEINKFFKNEN